MISFVHMTKKALIGCLLALSLLGQSCLATSFIGRHKIATAGATATVLLVATEVHHAYKKAKKESAIEAKKNNTKPTIKSFWDFVQDFELCKKHIRMSRIGISGIPILVALLLDWRKNRPQPKKDELKDKEEELSEDDILASFRYVLQQEMDAVQAVETVKLNDSNAVALQMRDFRTKPSDLIKYSKEYLNPHLQGSVENDIKGQIAKYVEVFLEHVQVQQASVVAETGKVQTATGRNEAMSATQARWTPHYKYGSLATEMIQHLGDTNQRNFYTQNQKNRLDDAAAGYDVALQAYVDAYITNITSKHNPDARRFDRLPEEFKKSLEDTFGTTDQNDSYKDERSNYIERLLQEQEDAAIQEIREENQNGWGTQTYSSHIWNDATAQRKVRAALKHYHRISDTCDAKYFNDSSLQRYKGEFKKYIRCIDKFMNSLGGWQDRVNYDGAQHDSLGKVQAALVAMTTCYTWQESERRNTLCDIFVREICCAPAHMDHRELGTAYETLDIPRQLEYLKSLVKPLVYFNTAEFENPDDSSKNIFNHSRIAFVQAMYARCRFGVAVPVMNTAEEIQSSMHQAVQLDSQLKFKLVGSGVLGGGQDTLTARMICRDPMDSGAQVGQYFDHIYGKNTSEDMEWRPYTTAAAKVWHNMMQSHMAKLFAGLGKSLASGAKAGFDFFRRMSPFSR